MAVQGTWGFGGFKLPDLGISEKFSKPGNSTFYNPSFNVSSGGGNIGGGGQQLAYRPPAANTKVGTPATVAGAFDQRTTGGGGGGQPQQQQFQQQQQQPSGPSPEEQAARDAENRVRSDINSGFDAYFGQLDSMFGNIGTQKAGQEQIVENSYKQGVSDLQAQQQSSLGDLGTQRRKNEEGQVKNLNDIADNIRNLYQAGNVMLGTKGAGDSSAANQYSYAVAKVGSKERGNVMSQTRSIENDIQDRESKLNNIVTQETTRLKTDRDNNILQVAQYFQDQQNALLQAKAQGQLQKGQSLAQLSTQLLQVAQQKLMQFDADYKNKENTLMSWAANNSTNINQLKSNLAGVGQYNAPGIQTNAINGAPQFDAQGNMTTSFGGGGGRSDEKNPNNLGLFGSSLYQ